MRLGDLDALRKNMEFICMGIMAGTEPYNAPLTEIDNAETVFNEYTKGFADGERSGRHFPLNDEEKATLVRQWRTKGEWIIVKDKKWGDNVKCPFCGKELAGTDLNFCCKCGAELAGSEKMNGGAE